MRSKVGEGSTFWVELPFRVGMEFSHATNGHGASKTSGLDTRGHYRHSSVVSSAHTREEHSAGERRLSESAMLGIMEQGGLFEIKLRKPDCRSTFGASPKLHADPMAQAALVLAQAQIESTSAQCPLPSPIHRSPPGATSGSSQDFVPPEVDLDAEAGDSVNVVCPTVLPNSDTMSPAEDVMVPSVSHASDNKLKRFDNSFAHGSPEASSTALNIEPGLPVLVVDDDLITRTLMKRLLTRLGCQVACAENGEMALEMILGLTHPFDQAVSAVSAMEESLRELKSAQFVQTSCGQGKFAVVFLDNQMPIMSGLKVVEMLRRLNRHDFVVGVTGNALLSGMLSLIPRL